MNIFSSTKNTEILKAYPVYDNNQNDMKLISECFECISHPVPTCCGNIWILQQ